MVSKEQLEWLEHAGGEGTSDALADLLDVTITGDTPVQRLESYLTQTGNPYRFRVGKTPVRITFHNEGKPLREKLKLHFLFLKNGYFS